MKRQDILFNPSDAHAELRDNVAKFAKQELDLQAKEYDETETFNKEVFQNWLLSWDYSVLPFLKRRGIGLRRSSSCYHS